MGTSVRTAAAAAFVLVSVLALAGCAQTSGFILPPADESVLQVEPTEKPALTAEPVREDLIPPAVGSDRETGTDLSGDQCPSFPARSGTWGAVGFRGYAFNHQMAPNGLEYKALFTIDFDFNVWLWQSQGLYLFGDTAFWGQRAAPGITNPAQGSFDFSKREFDFTSGLAWNYFGPLEARAFAYSFNNLNRGSSAAAPSGFADGAGLENRIYFGGEYARLGTANFDISRANFLSVGYYPNKDMVDADGIPFRPGPFVRAYLTLDLPIPRTYVYADTQLVGTHSFSAELLTLDAGLAARPWAATPRLEFRIGSGNRFDPRGGELETGAYGQVRYIY
jgi:hypothetical protein